MVVKKLSLCILILYLSFCHCAPPTLKDEERKSAKKLLNLTSDIIQDTDRRVAVLMTEQKEASGCAAFEIGYLTYILHEKYRRMVDKYNTSHYMRQRLYMMELIMYLEEIEHHYWEINHVANMLHEVERKYNIESELDVEYEEKTESTVKTGTFPAEYKGTWQTSKKIPKFKMHKYISGMATSTQRSMKPNNKWWPLDYGWEIDPEWWH